ncbi:MAG: DNA primase, partial [Microgenomates group bacterium]
MSQIQEVKDATDIVTVIGERLTLQRAGTYYKANCPFHSERSPSFFVNETIQRYKCYGCGEHGDVFEFLEKYEGLSFYETLKFLAEKAGITLKEQSRTKEDELRDEVLTALNLSKEYYHYLLVTHDVGIKAREYLKKRGISMTMIKHFGLGFSMDSWDGLLTYLQKKKKISHQVLLAAGLVITGKTNRSYDRFRGRIMFPLKNHRGQVVGFSGRTLESDPKEAKYINSPETLVYHKSALLFGYSEQLQEIRKSKTMIVVEGEFDVISSVQAHVPNIVAIKGSAFTKEQARLIARLVETVYLSLDTDAAGVKATKQALQVLKPYEIDVRVIRIPDGKDPDELARNHPKEWREAAKRSISVYEFLLESALKQHDETTPEGKRAIMKEIAPYISDITHAVEREHYISLLSQALKVKQDIIRSDVAMYSAKLVTTTQKSSGEQ